MKQAFSTLTLFLFISVLVAQPTFTESAISTSADGAWSVHAVDLDGDGDMDVLSASGFDDKIAWYENDGSQSFTEHVISTSVYFTLSVYAADVDGDGDMDVLSASYDDYKIAWYENNGSESFTEHTISTSAYEAISVHAADMDGDGDMDVLSASFMYDKIAWYENDGSEGFTQHVISTSADGAISVHAADMDGDGDMDVFSASGNDDKIAWYENDGSEIFTEHTISTSANGAYSVYAADVDVDGDLDVLSASYSDDKIAWYENDGSEGFTEHAISTSANGAYSVYAADVDGDGDMDVLSASSFDDKIAWYKNNGSQSFTEHAISTSADGAKDVYAADVDGDGDMDVLSASSFDDKIAWYENDGSPVQTTYVPDDNFEQALIDLGYDDAMDDYVLTANISGVTSLDVGEKEISDLTGIAGFTALTSLSCDNNSLTALDMSSNTALIYLYCYYNQLTSLDVSANTALTTLFCYNNQLTALDVSANTALTQLKCYTNQLTALDVSANTALTYLYCGNTQLTALDVSANTALTRLYCGVTQLTALDVSTNTALTKLRIYSNQLTSLDVSANTALTELWCYNNQLTSLDVSTNTALNDLRIYSNQLSSLDVSNNTALVKLYPGDNQLTALDVSANTALTELHCHYNQLTSLDVSNNTALTELHCHNNQLTSLDVSSNTALTGLWCYSNPELFCIQVADVDQAEQDWGNDLSTWMGFSADCDNYAYPTYVPDDNFEQALIDLGYDDVIDNYVITANISGVTSLDVISNDISDLTGIEDFTGLTVLKCQENNLSALDVSQNTGLTLLNCGGNNLTAIDVSANTALTQLNTYDNQLTSLDVTNNTAIETMYCYSNQLTDLDLSANTALTYLSCGYNQFTDLDLSANTALTYLACAYNELTTLDLSANTALTTILAGGNALTALDVSANTALTTIRSGGNELTALDVSANTALTDLRVPNNQLAALDVSANTALTKLYLNGNELTALDVSANTALTAVKFYDNPQLYCIQVADVDQAEEDWVDDISAWMGFSTDCEVYVPVMYVPDDNFEQALIDLGHDDILDDYVLIENISGVTSLNVVAKEISDLTGIEAFIALTQLTCYENQLTSVDVSNNTLLDYLHVGTNELTTLDVSNNTVLTSLYCYDNQLTALDVSNNTVLTSLYCYNNQLTTLDVSNNTALTSLDCSNNLLTALDVSANTALTSLSCSNYDGTKLTALDVSANTALTSLKCGNNQLTSLDVSQNTELTTLWVGFNSLNSLDVSANTALIDLRVPGNQLISMDVSTNIALEHLDFWVNQLTTLDVSANTALTTLKVSSNDIIALDVSANTVLTTLYCQNNQLTYLNMRNGVTEALTTFNATNNPDLTCIETLDLDYATENWTNIDEGVTFSVICGAEEQDVWHVATTGSDGGAGTQESPFATIQTGINAAGDGNTVHVAAGTYVENISYSGKSISIIGEDRETTIVDADTSGRAFYFDGESQHTIAFSGFTITNGESGHGGGIYITVSIEIDLFDLNVKENNCTGSGGGIYIYDSMGELTNVDIVNNESTNGSGGGIAMSNSDMILNNVNVIDNYARYTSGGASFGSDQFDESTTEWTNSVFTGNSCLYNASAIGMGDSTILSNLTVIQNTTEHCALVGWGNFTITNSIIRDNLVDGNEEAEAEINFNGILNMSYTNLSGEINAFFIPEESELILGEGNIDADPLFCEADSGNYHIAGNSPCSGTGQDGADMGALGVGCDDIWFPPTIATMADTSMDEDSELMLQLSAESEQGYDIYFEAESDTSSVYVYTEDDMLYINLETDWNGSSQITVMAYSEFDYEINNTTSFTLTVNPVNDEPMFHNLHALVGAGMEFHVPIHVTDVDMDDLVVSFDESWDYPDWLSLAANALTGTALQPVSVHFPLHLSDGEATVTDTFHLSAQFFIPRVTSVTDVPEDQGGRVYVSFLKSFFDHPDESNQMYTVFRHDMVDNVPDWVVVGSGAAIGEGSYTYEVATLRDSTAEGDGMTQFKVVASMNEGNFHSDPAMGYSTDDIAPGVPQGLMAVLVDEGIHITWEMSADEDFQYYMLEKSSDEAFTEPEVFEMIDIAYLDLDYVLNESNYYRIAAVDHAGNISDYSDVVDFTVLATDLDLIPDVFALHQNYPNPFNPTTQIKYDLPEDAMVSITIYDVMGRSIRSLVNTTQSAGYRTIQWDATNNLGEPVSAGMYIYMIQAGNFTQTKKMVLLK